MTHSQYIIARKFGMERLDKGLIATVKDFKAVALSVTPSSEQMKKGQPQETSALWSCCGGNLNALVPYQIFLFYLPTHAEPQFIEKINFPLLLFRAAIY